MTKEEEKSLNAIRDLLGEMKVSNEAYRDTVNKTVAALSKKVDEKHSPIYLEKDILSSIQSATSKAIEESLKGYNSPLTKLIAEVVNSRSNQLREIIASSFDAVINTEDFKTSIITAFSHKVAKTIISNNDGLFDKVSNELKQDAIFKSKMSIAVSTVVEECIRNKSHVPQSI